MAGQRKRFRLGIADSVRTVRDVTGGLRDEAREAFREVSGALRRRRRLF